VKVGPLINEPALVKVERHVADAVEGGAELHLGGERHDLGHTIFEPTVLTGVTPSMAISVEETFGPVAAIARFSTEEEAIRIANDTPYGLSAYFYSRSRASRCEASPARAHTAGRSSGRTAPRSARPRRP
jgi:succinate-semialdehyde dehydrogenase / glutarate-semialdehyde dehydrogenase